jgi:hypothetical protein
MGFKVKWISLRLAQCINETFFFGLGWYHYLGLCKSWSICSSCFT